MVEQATIEIQASTIDPGEEIMQPLTRSGVTAPSIGDPVEVPTGRLLVVYRAGQTLDILGPGRYSLDARTLPKLAAVVELPAAGTSDPLSARLFILNRCALQLLWGTRNPLVLQDPDRGALKIRAHGAYAIQIVDAAQFMHTFHGAQGIDESGAASNFLRDVIAARLQVEMERCVGRAVELPQRLGEILRRTRGHLDSDLRRYGIELLDLSLASLILPDNGAPRSDRRATGPDATAPNTTTPITSVADAGVGALLSKIQVQTLPDTPAPAAGVPARRTRDTAAADRGTEEAEQRAYCARCEDDAPAGARFCPWCGQELGGTA